MNDFIKALNIILLYVKEDVRWPFHCEHDILYICCPFDISEMTDEHLNQLEDLGILYDNQEDIFYSYRFGSC